MTETLDRTMPRGYDRGGFEHEGFLYGSPEEYVDRVITYVEQGLDQDEAVIVATSGDELGLVQAALAACADAIEFVDTAAVGVNPARMVGYWEGVVHRHLNAGRRLRVVAQPALPGRRPDEELDETTLLELALNAAFGSGPQWRLLCPYPEHLAGLGRAADIEAVHDPDSDSDFRDALGQTIAQPLSPVPTAARRVDYGSADLHDVRDMVARFARDCGAPEETTEDLRLAASELATNSVRYAGGHGSVALWREPDAFVVHFEDRGRLGDPMAGRRRPALGQPGGRGLFLVNQVCDFVQLRSSDSGTAVRITTLL